MPSTSPPDTYMTAQEVAEFLNRTKRTVWRMKADGVLTVVTLPTTGRAKRTRFIRAEVEAHASRAMAS